MAKRLTHTGEQLDEAIGKVLAGYTDVSEVTAVASDVRANKKFVSNQKVLTEGTIPDATVTASVTVSGEFLSDSESNFPVQLTPKATLSSAGYVSQGHTGDALIKYIKASEKTITANGIYDPPNNGFFSKIVANIPTAQLNPATISLSNGVLIITDGNNGPFSQYFDIYADAEEISKASVQINAAEPLSYDLSQLSLSTGSHTIYVRIRGTGMTDSEPSGNVTYVVTSQLPAPLISLSGSILSIGAVDHAVGYEIHADGNSDNLIQTTTALTYDLSGWLDTYAESFDITVYALAEIPYTKSPASTALFYEGAPVAVPVVSKGSGDIIVVSNIDPRAVAVDLKVGESTYRLWRLTLKYRKLFDISHLGIGSYTAEGFAPTYSLSNTYAPYRVLTSKTGSGVTSALLSATIGGVDSLSKFTYSAGHISVSAYAGVSGEVVLTVDGNTASTDPFQTLTYDTWKNADIYSWIGNYNSPGTYAVQARAVCPDAESSWSNIIQKHTYSITFNGTHCHLDTSKTQVDQTFIHEDNSKTLYISVEDGYALPETISVSGCNYTYTRADGNTTASISITNPSANIIATVVATKKSGDVVTIEGSWGDNRSANYEVKNGGTLVWSGSSDDWFSTIQIEIDHSKVTTVYTDNPGIDRGFTVYYGTTVVAQSVNNRNQPYTATIPAGTMFDRILFYDYN